MTTGTISGTTVVNELLVVTPADAQGWLEENVLNRNISWETVGNLSDQIKANDWQLDGNAIKFGIATPEFIEELTNKVGEHDIKVGDNVLLDGQHRLLAIIDAGIPVPTYVIHGLDPKAQMVMDTGRRRSLGDQLKLRGEKNTQQLAATITRVILTRIGEKALRTPARYRPSTAQALRFLDKEPTIRQAVIEGRRTATKLGGTSLAVLATCFYLFNDIDTAGCDEFFERLRDGEGLPSGDPILMLRNRLIANNRNRGETPPYIVQAWVIKAWNSFRKDLPMSQVSFRAIGQNPEAFPEPL